MVGWYNPFQLLRTGAQVLLSARWVHRKSRPGEPSDPIRRDPPFIDYSSHSHSSFHIDYLADCGDGWRSTYSVAYSLVLEQKLHRSRQAATLPRAEILVLGGDLVYPYPGDGAYQQRLVKPYSEALPQVPEPQPEVLAIPGNHDWYDGLVWFRRLFCSGGDFAAWKTRQSCSYFAARLPYSWWILGLDTGLR